MTRTCSRLRAALTAAALSIGGTALAHDTWFTAQPDGRLALGTGNRFPVAELGVETSYFAASGCRGLDGARHALRFERHTDHATLLRRAARDDAAATCFMQLVPLDVELAADTVELYFKEIRPSFEVVDAWHKLRARGMPFRERYVKSARIDLGVQPAPQPLGTAMDVLRSPLARPLAVGDEATFQVLRDGKPLAGFAVELVNERSPLGLWQTTDAQGRIHAKLPLPGRWLLRGTDLRVAADDATRFESAFVTYAFDVAR